MLTLNYASCIVQDEDMKSEKKLNDLLSSWEETYKKGQLTLWIFLSLQESKKYVEEIREFVETRSSGTITCEEQSLYRALRKYELRKGNKGPERKYYYLTPLGKELFNQFVSRNIHLFFSEEIKKLLKS